MKDIKFWGNFSGRCIFIFLIAICINWFQLEKPEKSSSKSRASWQTVLTKTIPGVGLEDGDEIKALARDQKFDGVLELQTGDKVVITGDVFWHETSEGWEEFKGGITLNVVNAIHVYVAAEDGQNIKVEVMRKIISTNLVYNN